MKPIINLSLLPLLVSLGAPAHGVELTIDLLKAQHAVVFWDVQQEETSVDFPDLNTRQIRAITGDDTYEVVVPLERIRIKEGFVTYRFHVREKGADQGPVFFVKGIPHPSAVDDFEANDVDFTVTDGSAKSFGALDKLPVYGQPPIDITYLNKEETQPVAIGSYAKLPIQIRNRRQVPISVQARVTMLEQYLWEEASPAEKSKQIPAGSQDEIEVPLRARVAASLLDMLAGGKEGPDLARAKVELSYSFGDRDEVVPPANARIRLEPGYWLFLPVLLGCFLGTVVLHWFRPTGDSRKARLGAWASWFGKSALLGVLVQFLITLVYDGVDLKILAGTGELDPGNVRFAAFVGVVSGLSGRALLTRLKNRLEKWLEKR